MKIKGLIMVGFIAILSTLAGCKTAVKADIATANNQSDTAVYGNYTVSELLQLRKDQHVDFGGRYHDESGALNISLVYKTAKNISKEELQQKTEDAYRKYHIVFHEADFSHEQLLKTMDSISDNMERLSSKGLKGCYIDEKDNRVHVEVKKINDDIKNEIAGLVDISTVEFEENELEVKFTFNN